MEDNFSTGIQRSWTWADQISTYRFWGLLVFFISSNVCAFLINTFGIYYLTEELKISSSESSTIIGIKTFGALLGFFVAYFATRWKTSTWLIILGLVQLLGMILLTFPSLAIYAPSRWVGAALIGLITGAVFLLIPSIIAGGRGGSEAFLIVFGTVYLISEIFDISSIWAGSSILYSSGLSYFWVILTAVMSLGLIFLLFVKPCLFNQDPPTRIKTFIPTRRNPVLVGLASIIPIYWYIWIYHVHGEVAAFAPKRNILSPVAAVLTCIFIPFVFAPLVTTKLNDAINLYAVETGRPPYRASWVILILSIFLLPVAAGLLQSTMNQIIDENLNSATLASKMDGQTSI